MSSKCSKFPCFIKVFSYVHSYMWLSETLIGSITYLKRFKGNIPPPYIIPLSVVYMFYECLKGIHIS